MALGYVKKGDPLPHGKQEAEEKIQGEAKARPSV